MRQYIHALLAEGTEQMKSQVHSLRCLGKERECLGPAQRQEKGLRQQQGVGIEGFVTGEGITSKSALKTLLPAES